MVYLQYTNDQCYENEDNASDYDDGGAFICVP